MPAHDERPFMERVHMETTSNLAVFLGISQSQYPQCTESATRMESIKGAKLSAPIPVLATI